MDVRSGTQLIRRLLAGALVVLAVAAASAQTSSAPEPAKPLIYYGGVAGKYTIERDDTGGNPFASGFLDVLKDRSVTLRDFGVRLAGATSIHARGWQQPDFPRRAEPAGWRFSGTGETRVALVLAVSDYTKTGGVPSLRGSKFDSERVTAALKQAGFTTTTLLDADRAGFLKALDDFAASAAGADVALIYVTGHGVLHKRQTYLIMGDYPATPQSDASLPTHALALPEISAAAKARKLNLILFAPCRDDPFQVPQK